MRDFHHRFAAAVVLASSLALLASCAKNAEPAQTPAEPEEAEADAHAEDDVSAEEAALLAQIEESADIADDQAEAATGADGAEGNESEAAREVVYRVSPEGLKIQINGAEFTPTAESIKVRGGYGVKLSVTASTEEERVLFSPKGGPMAFGGKVTRGGEVEKFGDRRKGSHDVALSPGSPIAFSRTWPADDQEPLAQGDELELHVMLWGLGPDAETRRPVPKFLLVKMTGGKSPQVDPPAQ